MSQIDDFLLTHVDNYFQCGRYGKMTRKVCIGRRLRGVTDANDVSMWTCRKCELGKLHLENQQKEDRRNLFKEFRKAESELTTSMLATSHPIEIEETKEETQNEEDINED